MKVLVIETRLITFDYFMSELQQWEVELFYDNLKYCDRGEYERCRLLMYVLALTNSKKQLKITDLMKFPWDSEGNEVETVEDTTENRNSLREKAKQFEKILLNLK